jgi:ATP-dependent phosphofructokinase / diphosphate-dependent phosphofructokinase
MNASLAGIVESARQSGRFSSILGARCGVEGVLANDLVDLTNLSQERLQRLRATPSAALGTSRHRPDDGEIQRILAAFRARGVTAFVPIGGNDTAETALRLDTAARVSRQHLRVVTVPKTIDNDLAETDHCPGYGSIARFVALAVRDAAFDTRAMAQIYPIKIVEVMGRNAGWLAAAGGLAFDTDLPSPVLCLPERPFADLDALAALAQSRIDRDGYCVMVVPETMKWSDGSPVAGNTPDWVDSFGHPYFLGVGNALTRQLSARLGVRARYDKPGTIARMAMHSASDVDLEEAWQCGAEAVRRALTDESGVMVTILRTSHDRYDVSYGSTSLDRVANVERRLSDDMIAECGHDTTEQFRTYATPLLGATIMQYEVLS